MYYPDRSQPIAEGHQVLEKTIGGATADLNLFGRIPTYLTFKRDLLYGHTPAITDLKIIGKVTLMRRHGGIVLLLFNRNKALHQVLRSLT